MKKDILKLIVVLSCIGLILFLGFTINSKKTYVADSFDTYQKKIDIKKTTWEIVQYSEGTTIENLVGTDWIVHFEESQGFIRLCDTHPFTYSQSGDNLLISFDSKIPSSCQESTMSSESVFLDLLTSKPIIAKFSYKTNQFNQVLTIVSGDKKMVLIPRTDILTNPTMTQKNTLPQEEKLISIKAYFPCAEDQTKKTFQDSTPCRGLPFQGSFAFEQLDAPEKNKTTGDTSTTGEGSVSLQTGTYQVTLNLDNTTAKVHFNPVIFSVTTQQSPQQELNITVEKI